MNTKTSAAVEPSVAPLINSARIIRKGPLDNSDKLRQILPETARTLIRLVLISEYTIIRAALATLLGKSDTVKVVGEAGDLTQACETIEREQPDIILLDADSQEANCLQNIHSLIAAAPTTRVILLTGIHDPQVHAQAVREGAVGVVRKESSVDVLVQAIDRVNAGEVWLERSMIATILRDRQSDNRPQFGSHEAKIATLTPREREILALVTEGLKNHEIAGKLFMSEATARRHLTSIFEKLEVSDRLDLVIYAFRNGLAMVDVRNPQATS